MTGHCVVVTAAAAAAADAGADGSVAALFSCALFPAVSERNAFALNVSDIKLCAPHTFPSWMKTH